MNAGIKLLNVPYKTSAAGTTALAAGEVDAFLIDAASMSGLWATGRTRPVAVSSATRMRAFPDLPTLREEGVKDYDFTAWFATYFARGTAPERVAAMRAILRKAVAAPSMQEALAKVGMEPLDMAGDELTALARSEVEVWTRVVKEAKLLPAQ